MDRSHPSGKILIDEGNLPSESFDVPVPNEYNQLFQRDSMDRSYK
jgi:hypothetical protein